MSAAITIALPWPPTVNTYYRTISRGKLAGRTLISERGRAYRKVVIDHLVAAACTGVGSAAVAVDIEARPPDRRRRDLDNLPKAVLDALTHGGVWEDDAQINDLRIWRSAQRTGEIIITITPAGDGQ